MRRILAYVAVAAVVVGLFVEVAQQDTAATDARLGVLPHALQLVHIDVLLTAGLGKLRQLDDVGDGIEQHGVSRCPVAPCTPNLLIEALNALGHVEMNHPADVALVNAHAEGDGGTDHQQVVVLELLLGLVALLVGQASVVGECVDALGSQCACHLLCCLPAQAVDDARIVRTGLDEVQDVVHLLSITEAALDGEAQVRAVKT